MSFMSLMADYVRLYLMVASVTERKHALGMYYVAYSTVHGKKNTPAMAKVKQTFKIRSRQLEPVKLETAVRQTIMRAVLIQDAY